MLLRLLLLVLAVGVIVSGALIFLTRLILRKARGQRAVTSRRERAAQWVFFALAGLGVACFLYGLWVEPYWPQITRSRVTLDGLEGVERPLRIVQISDLHSDPTARLEGRIPALVARLEPDLIVFTGDAVNEPAALPVFQRLMRALSRIAPTYAVRGNWDVWYWGTLPLYRGTGVRELAGEAVQVEVAGATLWLAGAAVDDEAGLEAALSALPADQPSVLLHHFPERVRDGAARGVDLVLTGDTHGGQIRLPLLGAVIEMRRFGVYHDMGLSRVGATWLYVNRGLGMEGGDAPRVRFLCRPEIALIELAPPGGG